MLIERVINSSYEIGSLMKVVTRGLISPLLWNLVGNKIFFKLNNKGTKADAYADELSP